MSEIDVSKCELIGCWFYIDHTPPKGQGDWGGAIHKGACKLNSTDCKDTPIEKCLIKSLYEQLKQSKAENEELRSDNNMLLAQGDADAFVISNLNFKIQKLQQGLDEIERLTKINIQECIDFDDCYRAREQMKVTLQIIKEVKENK